MGIQTPLQLFDPLGDRYSSQGLKSRHPNRSSQTVLGVRPYLPGDQVISGATRASEQHLRPQAVASNHRGKGLCSLVLKYKASSFNLNGCSLARVIFSPCTSRLFPKIESKRAVQLRDSILGMLGFRTS